MRERVKWASLAAICALVVLSGFSSACARSLITTRIIDAESGEPVNEAIVAYRWYKHKVGVPGLPAEDVTIEAGEEISDADGVLAIPKYSSITNYLDMCAYKQGYVCWNNLKIFPGWKERNDFSFQNEMVIRLEPFKEGYSKKDHARFTVFMSNRCPSRGRFGEAIEPEFKAYYEK